MKVKPSQAWVVASDGLSSAFLRLREARSTRGAHRDDRGASHPGAPQPVTEPEARSAALGSAASSFEGTPRGQCHPMLGEL